MIRGGGGVRERRVVWRAGLAVVLLGGCYSYTSLSPATPAPDTQVSLVLTDQGRVGASAMFGAGLERIDGRLVGCTDSAYVVQVARVTDVHGASTRWSGETLSVERGWVGNAYERRFSRSRTYVVAGAFTAAVAAFIATRVFRVGGPILQNPGGGGGGGNQ